MYQLELTENDIKTIAFVGNRYQWSSVLQNMNAGNNDIPEHIAWDIKSSIEADMEGGHDAFPMLDTRSELCDKLYNLYQSII